MYENCTRFSYKFEMLDYQYDIRSRAHLILYRKNVYVVMSYKSCPRLNEILDFLLRVYLNREFN